MAGRSPEGRDGEAIRRAFGVAVRAAREELGVSQERLAELCGKHRTYVSLIERGQSSPTLTTVFRIARALKVSPSELIERSDMIRRRR